jgi:hypothetical protein
VLKNKIDIKKWINWNFNFLQKYSGSDLLGVTAKVVDMPHHCTLFLSIYKNVIKFFMHSLLVNDMLQQYYS